LCSDINLSDRQTNLKYLRERIKILSSPLCWLTVTHERRERLVRHREKGREGKHYIGFIGII
jgi:hypothetical protein